MVVGEVRNEEKRRRFLIRLEWVEDGKKGVKNKHDTEGEGHGMAHGMNKVCGGKLATEREKVKGMRI